ncbi:MAG: beta-galactosidase, partial [Duncaniella sp.]|nr:beta-galactosidase [Duncaniella sp.]
MKRLPLLLLAACSMLGAHGSNDWENPQVFAIDRLAPRATAYPYPSAEEARVGMHKNSPYFLSLNGKWAFKYSPTPAERPVDFYEHWYNAWGWDSIPVPSNWEMQGEGTEIYT